MGLIMKLPHIMDESRKAFEEIMATSGVGKYVLKECAGKGREKDLLSENMLVRGDNLHFMKFLMDEKDLLGKVRLIYIDPPFFSKSHYGAEIKLRSDKIKNIPVMKQKAYTDTWEEGLEEYLKMLALRLMLMRELLADDGCIWVHLDWHAVHYVKVLMDEIFGEENFVNEIIWHYKSGGASKRRFARKHDTLLFYGKTNTYYFEPFKEKSYNRDYKPYRFKGVKEYRDELGWYTMVNRKDVWQLDMVGRTSAERTGYVTQKPETLIERILESCTREGDLCADFFGGSGTMAAVADRMGRKWISCDIGRLATISSHKRLITAGASYSFYEERGSESDVEEKGTIEAEISLQPALASDKMLLRVELTGYRPYSLKQLPVEDKYLPIVEKILDEDSLQFVAYWSIDCHYEKGINKPDAYICKNNEGIETLYETIGSEFGPVCIKVVDIFGNSAVLTANL
ncbi:MAG: DNA methyltransferase [Anaerovoracaceae bacterium]|jgi:site-specific DNA-methyltransferase (adenine-specific)